MTPILAIAASEIRIAIRNRWVAISVATMALFALVLTAAGSGPSGTLAADRLSLTVASLTSLAVYLVPLIALLISFDAVAGEVERGTLALALTYPGARAAILAGKFVAHLGVLALAVAAGYGVAALVSLASDLRAVAGLGALWRLYWSSLLLGATFLGVGYAVSAWARRPGAAAGAVVGIWLAAVVLYDLGLLAALVVDGGGAFTRHFFPWLLAGNPADAFRLFNLAASGATTAAAGVAGAADALPAWRALGMMLAWPLAAFLLAIAAFRRVAP